MAYITMSLSKSFDIGMIDRSQKSKSRKTLRYIDKFTKFKFGHTSRLQHGARTVIISDMIDVLLYNSTAFPRNLIDSFSWRPTISRLSKPMDLNRCVVRAVLTRSVISMFVGITRTSSCSRFRINIGLSASGYVNNYKLLIGFTQRRRRTTPFLTYGTQLEPVASLGSVLY